jgi:hypothetical protein
MHSALRGNDTFARALDIPNTSAGYNTQRNGTAWLVPWLSIKRQARGLVVKCGRNERSAIGVAVTLGVLVVFLFASGCRNGRTIWSTAARSPDGHWLASATTYQNFGPGTASVDTGVYLRRAEDSRPPAQAWGGASHSSDLHRPPSVGLNWLTPSHLEVTFQRGGIEDCGFLDYSGISGITISVRGRGQATEGAESPRACRDEERTF